jgi:outer membrane receptor for ferrienterochelin and colicin
MSKSLRIHIVWGIAIIACTVFTAMGQDYQLSDRRSVETYTQQFNKPLFSAEFHLVPLEQAVKQIADHFSLRIWAGEELYSSSKEVNLVLYDVSLEQALTNVLDDSGLDFIITENGHLILASNALVVQEAIVVSGRITDANTGESLPGANVFIQGTGYGAASAVDGTYEIRIHDMSLIDREVTINVRYVGYKIISERIVLRSGTQIHDFSLHGDILGMDEVVVTGTIVPTPIREIPNPITIVTSREIERLNPRNVAELFRSTVPGAVHTNEGPATRYGSFSVRGVSGLGAASTLKVYVDGVEVSDPAYITNLDPAVVERVEIISGPQASTMYGSRAISGVMQIFTKRGSGVDWKRPRVTGKLSMQVVESPYVDGNAFGSEYNVTVTGGDHRIGYNVGATVKEEPQWIDLLKHQNLNYFAGVNFIQGKFNGGVSVRYQEGYDEPFWNPLYRSLYQATGRPDNPPSSQVYDSQLATYSIRLGFDATTWWKHNFNAGYDGFERHWYDRVPGDDGLYGVRLNDTYRLSWAYNTSVERRLSSEFHGSIVLGVDYSKYSLDSYGTIRVDNWRDYERPELSTEWRRKSIGYFTQSQIGFRDMVFLTIGLRADQKPSGASERTTWSPRFGITAVHQYGDFTLKPRIAWGQAVIVPDERAIGGDESDFSILLPNPDLNSQIQRGYDAGVDVYYGDLAMIGISYFDQDPIDLIELINLGVSPTDPESRTLFQYQNVHRVKNRGVEVKTVVQPIHQLSIRLNYGTTTSTVKELDPNYTGAYVVGDEIPGRPSNTISGNIAYTPIRGTTLTVDMMHFGSWEAADFYGYLYDVYSGLYNPAERPYPSGYTIEYPALTKWNVGVSVDIIRSLTGFLHVHNVTDNDNFERMNMIIPQPRTYTLGLRYSGL